MSTPTGGPTNPIDAYAPKTPRTAPAQRADVAISEDVAALESKPSSHDPDGSLEPARPQDHRPRQPAANRRDAGMSDLRRLEATLRWIQREEAAARIPRAAQLASVPGLARADIGGRPRGDESSEFRLPRSLEPERMSPPPSRSRRPGLRASLIFLVAIILAAPSGYYLWRGYWSPPSHSDTCAARRGGSERRGGKGTKLVPKGRDARLAGRKTARPSGKSLARARAAAPDCQDLFRSGRAG